MGSSFYYLDVVVDSIETLSYGEENTVLITNTHAFIISDNEVVVYSKSGEEWIKQSPLIHHCLCNVCFGIPFIYLDEFRQLVYIKLILMIRYLIWLLFGRLITIHS